MWRRINVYLSDKDIELLWDISGKDLVDFAKKWVSIDKIDKIYDEIIKIWEKIVWYSWWYGFWVPNISTVQWVKNNNSNIDCILRELDPIEKKSMSMTYWKQRDKFKLARNQWWWYNDSWWVDFDELMNSKIFITIQSALDSWEYIED